METSLIREISRSRRTLPADWPLEAQAGSTPSNTSLGKEKLEKSRRIQLLAFKGIMLRIKDF